MERLPNSTGVLVMGILSLVFCCCYGIGFIFGIMAVYMSNQALKEYNKDPMRYAPGSLRNLKAGRVCGIIGLIGSAILIGMMIMGQLERLISWSMIEEFLTI